MSFEENIINISKNLQVAKKRSKKWTFLKKYLQSVKKLKMALKYWKKNLKLDLKSPWRILYNGSNFKLSKYVPELKCAFFSKSWWFSVKKLRLSMIEIWKKAHLTTVHDKKFSSWGIYYIYLRLWTNWCQSGAFDVVITTLV